VGFRDEYWRLTGPRQAKNAMERKGGQAEGTAGAEA
jgi:hypothetical protein